MLTLFLIFAVVCVAIYLAPAAATQAALAAVWVLMAISAAGSVLYSIYRLALFE